MKILNAEFHGSVLTDDLDMVVIWRADPTSSKAGKKTDFTPDISCSFFFTVATFLLFFILLNIVSKTVVFKL